MMNVVNDECFVHKKFLTLPKQRRRVISEEVQPMTGINRLVQWGIQFYLIINYLNNISSWFKMLVKVYFLKYHRINQFIPVIRCTIYEYSGLTESTD